MIHRHPHQPAAALRENRLAPRVPCSLPLRLSVRDNDFDGTLENLSTSGCGVALGRPLVVGEEVDLDFVLDAATPPVRCRGLVARMICSGEHLYGLRFAGVTRSDRSRIAAWVRRQLPAASSRTHWRADLGEAHLLQADRASHTVLSWPPTLPALFAEVVQRLLADSEVFVPGDCDGLTEGEGIHLELLAPFSHAVFRLLCEVLWVERAAGGASQPGVSLRLSALSPLDRRLLQAATCHPNDLEA